MEVFVHGALCVSYSGQCYVSQACFGRSANRGECAQFCRLPFSLVDAEMCIRDRNVPYRREEFREKHSIIEFNSDFNMVDGEIMCKQSSAKDMAQLQSSIDSMTVVGDSIGRQYYREVAEGNFRPSTMGKNWKKH